MIRVTLFLPWITFIDMFSSVKLTYRQTSFFMKFGDDLMYLQVFIVTDLLPFVPLTVTQFLTHLSNSNMEVLYHVRLAEKGSMLIIRYFSLVIQISKGNNVPSWMLNRLTVSFNLHPSQWWKICCNRRTKLKIAWNTCSLWLLLVSNMNQNT